MPVFSVYSLERKHYVGEFEFQNEVEAKIVVKEKYGENYTVKMDGIKDNEVLTRLIPKENLEVKLVENENGHIIAYVMDSCFFHYGSVEYSILKKMKKEGYETIYVSRSKFIKDLVRLSEEEKKV